MKIRISLSLVFLLLMLFHSSWAQDFSNKGKDFWVGYGSHVAMYNLNTGALVAGGGSQNMVLYFTSDVVANVKVEIPATGWVRSYSVTPNSVTETAIIPKTGADDARLSAEGVSNKGIHITSDNPIVAYAHIYDGAVSGAMLLFPTNTLGSDYYTLGFTQTSNNPYSYPFSFVIATEDNTLVEITPSANTKTHAAGVPFTQVLQKGEVLNLLGELTGGSSNNFTGVDFTGTRIRSISNGTSGCKKIAVYCGSGKINIKCNNSNNASGSSDNLIQQCFPASAWGKKYITVPTREMPNNFFRVMVNNPSTVVKLNGTALNGLQNGRYYEFQSSTTNIIEADNPIMVAQYITTANQCGNTSIGVNGDPEMIYLSPIEQTINKITLNSTTRAFISPNYHYINVIMKTSGVSSFRLDGANLSGSFLPLPTDPTYSYLSIKTSAGIHNLASDSGFNAIAYGYGNAESYGYNAGTNVKDLYQFVSIQNQYATVDVPSTCRNTPFLFSITLPYKPTSLSWDFNNNPNLAPNTSITENSPREDSSYVKDGKTLYVYRVKGNHAFSAVGTYPVKVTANNTTADGCSGMQEINYEINVLDPPKADFSVSQTGCASDTTFFTDATNGTGRPVTRWLWDFGDGTTDSVKNPTKKFATPNTYNVKLFSITDLGCFNEVTKPVTITPKPVAKFGVSENKCVGNVISFTDSSKVESGTIVKWIWNFGEGGAVTSLTNAPITHTYNKVGKYTVTLEVETGGGCKSLIYSEVVDIHTYPVADFTFTEACLPTGAIQFSNKSAINDPQPALSYAWNFGDGGTSTAKDTSHRYSSVGPFDVKLTATSIYGCSGSVTKAVNTIYPQPKADFAVTPEVCLGDTTAFNDQSNGANIVRWEWNFGDGKTALTRNPTHLYNAPGTNSVSLLVYSDKGCASDTMLKSTLVNPLPVADFTTSSPTCETKAITVTDKSSVATGTVAKWSWNFGDGTTSNPTNAGTFPKTFDSAGSYNVSLRVESAKGCANDTTKTVTVNYQPTPAFILPEVCLNDAFAEFKDSSSIDDKTESSFTYAWNFGDANSTAANPNTSAQKNGRHKYSAVGSYNVTLTVTSKNGCATSLTKPFIVNGAVPVSDFAVVNNNGLCSNAKVEIKNNSTVDFGSVTKLEIIWDVAGGPSVVVTDENPSPDKIYSHSYPNLQTTKNYQVKVRAYSGGSCFNEKTKTITVNASPKVSFETVPGICLDASPRQITQASEKGGVAGSASYSGAGVSPAGMFNPTVVGVGSFPVQYLYTSNAGCRDSATKTITVWKSPNAGFGISSPTCEAAAITFSDSSLANFGKITQWSWSFSDGTTNIRNSANPFNKTFAKAGAYDASLQVKTDSGCMSQPVTKRVIVHVLPVVDFSLPTVCLPSGNAQFNDLSTIADGTSNQFTYLWNFGDPSNTAPSTQKNPLHKYSTSGPFTVWLQVTSANGCISSATKQLTTVYDPPKADFSIAPPEGCLGTTFAFNDLSAGVSGNITSWNWNHGDGTTSTSQNTARKYSNASTYDVGLVVMNDRGCTSLPTIKRVSVHPFPTVNIGSDLVVLEGGSIVINPTVTATAPTFKWTPSTYLNNDAIQRPTASPVADVTYKLMVTGRGGCAASDDVFVKILKGPNVPNAFSPNGDGINDTWTIEHLSTYPGATVEVFNRYGQIVFRSFGYNNPWDGKVNGSLVPVGVYYYIIDPKNGRKQLTGSITILR